MNESPQRQQLSGPPYPPAGRSRKPLAPRRLRSRRCSRARDRAGVKHPSACHWDNCGPSSGRQREAGPRETALDKGILWPPVAALPMLDAGTPALGAWPRPPSPSPWTRETSAAHIESPVPVVLGKTRGPSPRRPPFGLSPRIYSGCPSSITCRVLRSTGGGLRA